MIVTKTICVYVICWKKIPHDDINNKMKIVARKTYGTEVDRVDYDVHKLQWSLLFTLEILNSISARQSHHILFFSFFFFKSDFDHSSQQNGTLKFYCKSTKFKRENFLERQSDAPIATRTERTIIIDRLIIENFKNTKLSLP